MSKLEQSSKNLRLSYTCGRILPCREGESKMYDTTTK